jgi:redox-sensitive bicupin YhaK (pirin superfamily)
MVKVYPFESLGKANYGWLNTNYHFSFANYYNPNKVHMNHLRVINDDVIKGKTGFDTHPHHDMEIITYIIDGVLTHEDSMGNVRDLGPGGVQYMSAGTGVTHSEKNAYNEDLHLYQIWIFPNEKGLTPNYGDKNFTKEDRFNKLFKIVSGENEDGVIKINQDASISIGEFDQDMTFKIPLRQGEKMYVIAIDGKVDINGTIIKNRDGAEVDEDVTLKVFDKTHVLLIKSM